MQARKDEILAKKAKLAELKRQRELRQKEFTQNRASIGDASEVNTTALSKSKLGLLLKRISPLRLCRLCRAEQTAEPNSTA